MNNKFAVIAVSIMILVIFASACTPVVPPVEANIPPREVVQPGQGITPVVPSGGTEDDPVINLMGSCPSFERLQYPCAVFTTSFNITQVHSLGLGETISCNLLQAGDCSARMYPSNPYSAYSET